MRQFIIFLVILFLISCGKSEELTPVDLCPTCTAMVQLNDEVWPCDLRHATLHNPIGADTFFWIEFNELDAIYDKYKDAVLFWKIPYDAGIHSLDSFNAATWGTDATLFVFQGGYDAPEEHYETYPDSSSYFDVTFLDKSTGRFEMDFLVYLYPDGNPGSAGDNKTYPDVVEFKGKASGVVEPE